MTAKNTEEERQRNLEKQRRKIERERAAGFIRRTVTIPIERDPEHKKIVAEWRAQKTLDKPGNED